VTSIGKEESGQCFDEVRILQERSDNFRTSVHDRDDVLEIMAGEEIVATATMKGFELGGNEQRRRDNPGVISCDTLNLRRSAKREADRHLLQSPHSAEGRRTPWAFREWPHLGKRTR